MDIDSKTILRISKLARLDIASNKHDIYAKELSNIVKILDELQEVDTKDLDPVVNISNHNATLREDIVTDGHCDDKILSNAPEKKFDYFVVPKVVK